jgi:serine/threonine protein kinase
LKNGNLKKEIQRTAKEQNIISNDRIKIWIGQMIEAIYYLHNNRVIHRDLKPA